jgi:hemerythrin-like domain-containing protein
MIVKSLSVSCRYGGRMNAQRRPASLPGFSSPAAGFDEPMAMLSACHDRMRRSLDQLTKICTRLEAGRIDEAVHHAARDVLRYFDQAAPNHHEDEEQHIFPRLLADMDDPAVRTAVLQLQEDHLRMESHWSHLRTPLAALATGHAEGFDAGQIQAARTFIALYGRHLQTEDTLVFPAAAALLDAAALRDMGAEMASRRGAKGPA